MDDALLISPSEFPLPMTDESLASEPEERVAVLAGGCFWCVEAVYRQLDGVTEVVSGYSGGTPDTADYRTVSGGGTDHAEVVRIRYDGSRTTLGRLLRVFFSIAHDPTQRDRQGNDVGRQYRSAIFAVSPQQQQIAEAYIRQLDAAGAFSRPIVTEVVSLSAFHPAEAYHQNYAALNPNQPYIAAVATPKTAKLRTHFAADLRDPQS